MKKLWNDGAWEEYEYRLIFRIRGEQLEITACKGHYGDK